MPSGALEAAGFAYYLDELRRSDALDPYLAYRVYDRSWRVPQKDADLLRRATIRLIETDPWFLATAMPHFLSSLTIDDLERVTPRSRDHRASTHRSRDQRASRRSVDGPTPLDDIASTGGLRLFNLKWALMTMAH